MALFIRWRVAVIGAVAVSVLMGCQTTGPTVASAVDNDQVACTVGADSASHTVTTRAWRGSADALGRYDASAICARLGELGQSLQGQSASLRFALTGPVSVRADLDRADNAVMRAWPAPNHEAHLVIVDAIAQCGNASGYILGCTPQVGRPVVFVKQHAFLQDWAPEWVIWAHELGHAAGLYHPDSQGHTPTFPQRLMTYMPTPDSTSLVAPEPARLNQLAQASGGTGGDSGAAVGAGPGAATSPITAAQLVPFLLRTGVHGVPLDALAHLGDNALLTLRVLLIGGGQTPVALPIQINALVAMAELGADQAQAYVRSAVGPGGTLQNLSLRRYGLWALGRGQQRHPTPQTQQFLQQARSPAFWCANPATPRVDCNALSQAATQAWQDTGLVKASPKPSTPSEVMDTPPQSVQPKPTTHSTTVR